MHVPIEIHRQHQPQEQEKAKPVGNKAGSQYRMHASLAVTNVPKMEFIMVRQTDLYSAFQLEDHFNIGLSASLKPFLH